MISNQVITADWAGKIPDGWRDGSLITLIGDTGKSGVAANIVVNREVVEASTTIEDYAALQADLMQREIAELQILDERPITIKGVPAFQRLMRFIAEDIAFQQVQTFFLRENVIYAITGTAAVEDFDESIYAFKEFVESFEFSE